MANSHSNLPSHQLAHPSDGGDAALSPWYRWSPFGRRWFFNRPFQNSMLPADDFFADPLVSFPDPFFSGFDSILDRTRFDNMNNQMNRMMCVPKMDLKEHSNNYVLTADLPGIKKDDVKVQVDKGRLTVSGSYGNEHVSDDHGRIVTERCKGSFTRGINLGNNIAENKVRATMNDGVLEVTVPKENADKSKSIRID